MTLVLIVTVAFIAIAGCAGEKIGQSHTVVYKTDSNGSIEWVSNLDTGMRDQGRAIHETSDGGYLVAGFISDNPKGDPGYQVFPRVVRLDRSGRILWDTVLNTSFGPHDFKDAGSANAIAETPDRHVMVTTHYGFVLVLDPSGTIEQALKVNSSGDSLISERDMSLLISRSEGVSKFNSSGFLMWKNPTWGDRKIFQTGDGGYCFESSNNSGKGTRDSTTCLDPNGTTLWEHVGEGLMREEITSFYEPSPGFLEVTYLREDRTRTEGLAIHPALTKSVLFDTTGKILAEKNLTASKPLIRTSDGGYAFTSGTFGSGGEYSPNTYTSPIHIARLSQNGSFLWDRVLVNSTGGVKLPSSLIQTKDGGFAVLVIE
ncbi:MAG: hypothetical protein Q8R70_13485 [Methanoregula sp.]|nr:hypothetical protein [Methanoregula sp.]